MKKSIDLSIVIINFNTSDLTIKCIKSILSHIKGIHYEILLIDNASDKSDLNKLKLFVRESKKITLIENKKNLGFSGANNQGINQAKGEYLLLLNSDTIISSNILEPMVKWLEAHPKVGIVSCQLYNADGSIQGTGGYFPSLGKVVLWMLMIDDIPLLRNLIKPFHSAYKYYPNKKSYKAQPVQLDWLTGAFFLMRKEIPRQIGELDGDYFMYVEDVDYCYRAWKSGWEIWLLPQYSITHLGGASSTSEYPLVSEFKNLQLFYKKHLPHWQRSLLSPLFKAGALLRVLVLGILKGPDIAKLYVKTFKHI